MKSGVSTSECGQVFLRDLGKDYAAADLAWTTTVAAKEKSYLDEQAALAKTWSVKDAEDLRDVRNAVADDYVTITS